MISKDNTRTIITLPKDLKEKLEILAKADNRSLNNLIVTNLLKLAEESNQEE